MGRFLLLGVYPSLDNDDCFFNEYQGLAINTTLGNPTGTMMLRGTSRSESFVFRIVRETRDGRRTVEPLSLSDGQSVAVIMAKKCGTTEPHMVPEVEKEE
jgi:hypothetical protein